MTNNICIKELKTGGNAEGLLMVKQATLAMTKTKKPYVRYTFTDGASDISANVWDTDKAIEAGTVVSLKASVTEYNANLQLNIFKIEETDVPNSAFAPQCPHHLPGIHEALDFLMDNIATDKPELAEFVGMVLTKTEGFSTLPAANSMHHDYVNGLLCHSVAAGINALHIASTYDADVALCVAGALLHDIGKVKVYAIDNAVIKYTDEGNLAEHMVLGYSLIDQYARELNEDVYRALKGDIEHIKHIILSHHGRLEYGASVKPATTEAMIVCMADGIDAKLEMARAEIAKLKPEEHKTPKIFGLENSQIFKSSFFNK